MEIVEIVRLSDYVVVVPLLESRLFRNIFCGLRHFNCVLTIGFPCILLPVRGSSFPVKSVRRKNHACYKINADNNCSILPVKQTGGIRGTTECSGLLDVRTARCFTVADQLRHSSRPAVVCWCAHGCNRFLRWAVPSTGVITTKGAVSSKLSVNRQ